MTIVAEDDAIQIERLELGPFGTNAYIVTCRKMRDSALIDAPAEANIIMDRLKNTNPKYILLTHNHMDHIGALAQLRAGLKVPLAAHALDAGNLTSPPEILLSDGDTISLGNLKFEVLHTQVTPRVVYALRLVATLYREIPFSPGDQVRQGRQPLLSR